MAQSVEWPTLGFTSGHELRPCRAPHSAEVCLRVSPSAPRPSRVLSRINKILKKKFRIKWQREPRIFAGHSEQDFEGTSSCSQSRIRREKSLKINECATQTVRKKSEGNKNRSKNSPRNRKGSTARAASGVCSVLLAWSSVPSPFLTPSAFPPSSQALPPHL